MRIRAVLALAALAASAAAAEPRREDHGDLVVLHVEGTYREMGRQQVELLGPLAREVYAFNRVDYARSIRAAGLAARGFDRLGLPIASWRLRSDPSGMGEQIAGIAEGLGVAPREAMRAGFALDAGSTVFLATGSATADGAALIGRNADWGDAGGRRRPVVTIFRPTHGDLAHIAGGWPLLTLPVIGLNEAGFALSMNFFETEPLLQPFGGAWPHRRALQTARTVEDGLRIFTEAGPDIAFACFMAMADASGAIAMVECRPGQGCATFRPSAPWFAHANHARSAAMIPHDRYRSPDSFARQRGMERAVRLRARRAHTRARDEVLRDRGEGAYPNDTTVANLFVLNAAVVAPKQGVLWHSTRMQPFAPFGAYVGVSLARSSDAIPALPAAPRLDAAAERTEAEAIETARRGVRALRGAREADTGSERAALAADARADPGTASPPSSRRASTQSALRARPRARAPRTGGDLAGAYTALAPAEAEGAPFEARAQGLAARALLADRSGRREGSCLPVARDPRPPRLGARVQRLRRDPRARRGGADRPRARDGAADRLVGPRRAALNPPGRARRRAGILSACRGRPGEPGARGVVALRRYVAGAGFVSFPRVGAGRSAPHGLGRERVSSSPTTPSPRWPRGPRSCSRPSGPARRGDDRRLDRRRVGASRCRSACDQPRPRDRHAPQFDRPWAVSATVAPGRMGLPASLSWTLIGAGIWLQRGDARMRQGAPRCAASGRDHRRARLDGPPFGAESLYRSRASRDRVPTSTISSRRGRARRRPPRRQPMRGLIERRGPGVLTRRTLPFVIVLRSVLGWVRSRGQEAGAYDTRDRDRAPRPRAHRAPLVGPSGGARPSVARHEREIVASAALRARAELVLREVRDQFLVLDEDWRYAS